MKAIRTRFYGPTDTRGARIVATDGDRNSVSHPYPHELNSNDAHYWTAYALCVKLNWPTAIIGGGFKNDMYWVFLP